MDFESLYQQIATPLGLPAASTKLLAERKMWINRAVREIFAKHDWPNAYDGEFQTIAPVTTGTVSCTLGATAMTVSGVAWTATSGPERRKIKIGEVVHDLTAVASGGCTLAKPAPAEYDGEDYILFQDEFDLPSTVGDITAAWIDADVPLEIIQHPQMSRLQALSHIAGAPPKYLHRIGYDAEGDLIIRLSGYPNGLYHVHYTYEKRFVDMTETTDVPDILPEDAHFLIPLQAETHVARFEREGEKRAMDAFANAWYEYAVGKFQGLTLELEPAMFPMDED